MLNNRNPVAGLSKKGAGLGIEWLMLPGGLGVHLESMI